MTPAELRDYLTAYACDPRSAANCPVDGGSIAITGADLVIEIPEGIVLGGGGDGLREEITQISVPGRRFVYDLDRVNAVIDYARENGWTGHAEATAVIKAAIND